MNRFFIMLAAVLATAANAQAHDFSGNAVDRMAHAGGHGALRLLENGVSEPLSATPVGHNSHDHHWHFVGCVTSHSACEHHAADHGYHHHRVKHNHHNCHHEPHLACYGRN